MGLAGCYSKISPTLAEIAAVLQEIPECFDLVIAINLKKGYSWQIQCIYVNKGEQWIPYGTIDKLEAVFFIPLPQDSVAWESKKNPPS